MRRRQKAHLSSIFWVKEQKISNGLYKKKQSPGIAVSKTVNIFRIDWTIIEKSWPEHDPKFIRLSNLLPTRSSLWRLFLWKCKTIEGYLAINFEVASSNGFRDIKKHFVTVEAAVDIYDSIKRKRIRVSLKNRFTLTYYSFYRHD